MISPRLSKWSDAFSFLFMLGEITPVILFQLPNNDLVEHSPKSLFFSHAYLYNKFSNFYDSNEQYRRTHSFLLHSIDRKAYE